MTITYDHRTGLAASTGDYDEEQFRSFLLSIRMFLLNDEPTHIPLVLNVAERRLTDDDLRRKLREVREHWHDAQKKSPVTFQLADGTVAPERIVSLWINGTYFHNDADARLLEQLFPDVGKPLARFTFEDFLLTATQVVLYTANVLTRARTESLLQFEP